MEERRFFIGLMKGFVGAKLAVLALCLLLFLRGPWCGSCRGSGDNCPDCAGSGIGRHLNLSVTQPSGTDLWHVVLSRDGRKVWQSDLMALPAVGWLGGGVVVLVGLFVGLMSLACPLCARRGTLLLEVEPPGSEPERRFVECPACAGRGTLTRLDCWLAGV
jgi:hypothetical protein